MTRRKGFVDMPSSPMFLILMITIFVGTIIYIIITHINIRIIENTNEAREVAANYITSFFMHSGIQNDFTINLSKLNEVNHIDMCQYSYDVYLFDFDKDKKKFIWNLTDGSPRNEEYAKFWIPVLIRNKTEISNGILLIKIYKSIYKEIVCKITLADISGHEYVILPNMRKENRLIMTKEVKDGRSYICFDADKKICVKTNKEILNKLESENDIIIDETFEPGARLYINKYNNKLALKLIKAGEE